MRESLQLQARWYPECSIINLRCEINIPGVRQVISKALGQSLPEQPCTCVENQNLRILWIGPDEWQILSTQHEASTLETTLRNALAGQHFAVTDVSSNYQIMQLSGEAAREVLAQGCPLDLHPRVFKPGQCMGSHYFKAAIWLWQTSDQSSYELLIRRSFAGYVWLMLERASAEYNLLSA